MEVQEGATTMVVTRIASRRITPQIMARVAIKESHSLTETTTATKTREEDRQLISNLQVQPTSLKTSSSI